MIQSTYLLVNYLLAPAIFFWVKNWGKTGYELHIRTNTKDQHATLNDGIDTVPIPPNKWTRDPVILITLKGDKLTVKLSGAVTKNL